MFGHGAGGGFRTSCIGPQNMVLRPCTHTREAVGSRSAASGEQVGVSGALLKGTSSVDEDIGENNYTTTPLLFTTPNNYSTFLPAGWDSNRPPSGYRSNFIFNL